MKPNVAGQDVPTLLPSGGRLHSIATLTIQLRCNFFPEAAWLMNSLS